ncbi:MAG: hypothetical protein WDW36_000150 [Sanguina aurantia]
MALMLGRAMRASPERRSAIERGFDRAASALAAIVAAARRSRVARAQGRHRIARRGSAQGAGGRGGQAGRISMIARSMPMSAASATLLERDGGGSFISRAPAQCFTRRLRLAPALGGGLCAAPLPTPATPRRRWKPVDIAWLQRVGSGVNSAELASYQKLGRSGFLDNQLSPSGDSALPPEIAAMIGSYEAVTTPLPVLAAQLRAAASATRCQGIFPDGDPQIAAKKALRIHGRDLAMQAQETTLLRLIYGTDQLNEQMVWLLMRWRGRGGFSARCR